MQCLLQSRIYSTIISQPLLSSVCLQLLDPNIMWQTNSLTLLLPESTFVGQHSTSPNCVIILANFNIFFFLLDTDTFSSMNAIIHHHIFTFINHFSFQCTQNSIFISAYCDLIKEVNSTDLQYLCLSITISIFQSTLKQQQTSEQHNFASFFFFSKHNLSHYNYLKFVSSFHKLEHFCLY